jgi:hypothetical protein
MTEFMEHNQEGEAEQELAGLYEGFHSVAGGGLNSVGMTSWPPQRGGKTTFQGLVR